MNTLKENKLYSLVLFKSDHEDSENHEKEIDTVPTSWLFRDERDNIFCPFVGNDASLEEKKYLQMLVKLRKLPDPKWNSFEVDIRGDADTYDDALHKVEDLQRKPYVFTTDNDKHVRERQAEIRKKVRMRGQIPAENMKNLLSESAAALHEPLQVDRTLSVLQDKVSGHGSCQKKASQGNKPRIIGDELIQPRNLKIQERKTKKQPSSAQQRYTSGRSSDSSSSSEDDINSAPHKEAPSRRNNSKKNHGSKQKRYTNMQLIAQQRDMSNASNVGRSMSKEIMKGARRKEPLHGPHDLKNINISQQRFKNMELTAQQQYEADAAEIDQGFQERVDNQDDPPLELPQPSDSQSLEFKQLLSFLTSSFAQLRHQIATVEHEVVSLKQPIAFTARILSERTSSSLFVKESLNLPIPFAVLIDFEVFDEKLKQDKGFQTKVTQKIASYIISTEPMVKSMRRIFEDFFTRDVILQLTAIKPTKDKKVLKNFKYYNCLKRDFEEEFKRNPDAGAFKIPQFNSAIGRVINYARDWDGHRAKRANNEENPNNSGSN